MKAIAFALAASALLLAGCDNVVASEKPWFTKSDADRSLRLKPGYWGLAVCPPGTPPTCGTSQVEITDSEFRFPPRWGGPQPDPLIRPVTFVAVPGDPIVIQAEVRAPPEHRGQRKGKIAYVYAGFAPTQRDSDGQVIAGELWPVVCGPAPREGDENYGFQDDQGQMTNHPLPGLTMDAGGCQAKDRAALIGAARATRTMDGAPLQVEWKSPPSATTR